MRHPEDLLERLIDATTLLPANPMRPILADVMRPFG
jgi:hypothetical protein